MIHAHKVQYAMEHENPDFVLHAMPVAARLGAGARQGNGDISEWGKPPGLP
jgi:hypothetical protein